MTRINALHHATKTRRFIAWGRSTGAIVFAALLIACSVTVGCSSDKPKSVSSNIQAPIMATPAATQPTSTLPSQSASKPAAKKVVHRKPATVNYSDKTSGVTFEYPRRYAIETGEAAVDLLASSPMPMNFVQPGGVALAAVELPETSFSNTDFSSAFFDVSVHKTLTADQCTQFAVPEPKIAVTASTEAAPEQSSTTQNASGTSNDATTSESASTSAIAPQNDPQGSKLMLGDLELRGTEAVTGEGARQSDSKYFHVFQNGSCYEFAMNVTTVASHDGITKHVDRDKVFNRLEKILSTVKINPVTAPEVNAETVNTPAPTETPANN
jgi:hypothetical protein